MDVSISANIKKTIKFLLSKNLKWVNKKFFTLKSILFTIDNLVVNWLYNIKVYILMMDKGQHI